VGATLIVVTPFGRCNLTGVVLNVIPGPAQKLLIGRPELRRMGIPTMWSLIDEAIKNGTKGKQTEVALQTVELDNWKKRRQEHEKDEPDCIQAVDQIYGHGGAEPTKKDTLDSMRDILTRAEKSGASSSFLKKLEHLVFVKHKDIWRLMLGRDPPARMEPMVIQFAEDKFPRNIQPRKYGPEQKKFLRERIPIMLKAKILQLSHSRFGCCPFIPYKSDGSLKFCLDQRPANKVIEFTKFPIPDMHEMVQSVNGSKFFACLDAAQGYF